MPDLCGPRDERGRFFDRECPDPNCDGKLVPEDGCPGWRCNGLTHLDDDGPLIACSVWHRDGQPRPTHEVDAHA